MSTKPINKTPLRVAIDTGGTFTDCVWNDPQTGETRMLKIFSTPDDPSQAIAEAIAKIGHPGSTLLLHGTTVGTNTLLQRKGARVAFVTTKGFEDSIEIGRQTRPKLYDFFFDAIPPLVPPELRFGVSERTDKDGNILRQPAAQELAQLTERVIAKKPDAIAISLLFCFANPANEKAVEAALKKVGVPLSVAHRILPEFREYERASTVVVNAYLQPVMERYLRNLAQKVAKGESKVFVMQSSGGLTSLETAAAEPVRTVLSGPAGGVVGAAAVAARSGFKKIIGFDMGGTSTDVCLVEGTPATTNEAEIAGLPVRVPMLDIHTVGAGGGSIARFDAGGALRVGPESAGADPGPICYGRGSKPTVTDANMLLGRLPANQFLGGEFTLDEARTRRLTGEWLRQQRLSLSVERFAEGVVRVVNANMEKAIRVVSIEKGHDPRDYSLVAFGGAGALHACELAAELEIPRVLVPTMPGALSAIGILNSDVVKDHSRTLFLTATDSLPRARLHRDFAALKSAAAEAFKSERWSGKVESKATLDMRYKGQGYEISVPYSDRSLHDFHAEHQRRYGYSSAGKVVELVTIRLRAWIASKTHGSKVLRPTFVQNREGKRRVPELSRVVFQGKAVKAVVMARSEISENRRVAGPAIITEYSATTCVPPGWKARVDACGVLVLSVK